MGKTAILVVYIDTRMDEWLSKKAEAGYKKSSLARNILKRQMELEAKGVAA